MEDEDQWYTARQCWQTFTGERVGSAKKAGTVAFPAAVMSQILLVIEKTKLD